MERQPCHHNLGFFYLSISQTHFQNLMTFKKFPTPNAISISSCYMSSSAGIGNFYKPITGLKYHQSLVILVTGCVFAHLNCANTPYRMPHNSKLPGSQRWNCAKAAAEGSSSREHKTSWKLGLETWLATSLRVRLPAATRISATITKKAAVCYGETGKEMPGPWKKSGFPVSCTLIALYL